MWTTTGRPQPGTQLLCPSAVVGTRAAKVEPSPAPTSWVGFDSEIGVRCQVGPEARESGREFVVGAVDKRSSRMATGATLLALCLLTLWLVCLAAVAATPGALGSAARAAQRGTSAAFDSAAPKGAGGAVAPSGGGTPGEGATKVAGRPSSAGRPVAVRISVAMCVPATHCSTNPRQVSVRGELLVKGVGLQRGMVVAFPRSYGARIARNSPTAHIASSRLGIVVHVPGSAHSGRIMIVLAHGHHSNSYGPIQVVNHALHPPTPPTAPAATPSVTPSGSAFDGQGMWIWYVSQSDHGSLAAIVAQAHAAGVGTLFVEELPTGHRTIGASSALSWFRRCTQMG